MRRIRQQAFETLSIWEVGVRLHDLDPDIHDETTIGPEVRETIRNLMEAAEGHFNLLDREGNELLPTYNPIFRSIKDHPAVKRLQADATSRKIEKSFLDTLFIFKDEFEYWYLMNNQTVPSFWFTQEEIDDHFEQRREAFGNRAVNESALSTNLIVIAEHDTKASAVSEPEANHADEETGESVQSKAAQFRHAERNAIGERFLASLHHWPLVKADLDAEAIRYYSKLTESQRVELARSRSEYIQALNRPGF